MFAYAIDDSGYIIENYLIGGGVEIPDGCIDVQLPQPLIFHKPKWDGEQWGEGATQEEIDEINNSQPTPKPSEIERIEALEQENAILKAQKQVLAEQVEFHEELIIELAMQIYE